MVSCWKIDGVAPVSVILKARDEALSAFRRVTENRGAISVSDLQAVGGFFHATGIDRAVFRFEGGGGRADFQGIDTFVPANPPAPDPVTTFLVDISNFVADHGPTLNLFVQGSSPQTHLSTVAGGAFVFEMNNEGPSYNTEFQVIVSHTRTTDC